MKKTLITICLFLAVLFLSIDSQALAKSTFNKSKAKKNIKVTYQQSEEGILATYKNKNKFAVKIKMTLKYKDAAGQTVADETITCECFPSKKSIVYFFRAPLTGDGQYLKYNTYVPSFSVAKTKYTDRTKDINVITNVKPTQCKIMVQNLGKANLSTINLTFLFYDASGNFICARNQYIKGMEANTTIEQEVSYAGYTPPAAVKIYKNWAY